MTKVTATMVKELRERTNLGMMECKTALTEAQGDMDKAIEILRKKGAIKTAGRAGREAAEGCIQSYIHTNGKVGVMIEARSETDFVAKNEEFQAFIRDVCMHIAWANPVALDRDEIPDEVLEREKSIYAEQIKDKPEHVREQILEGKLRDFFKRACLLDQEFVKDSSKSVGDLVTEQAHKFGENIYIKRFVRYEVGDTES